MCKSSLERGEEIYSLYRDYIKHEDSLINYRITWLISIQAFLIATFGFSYQKRFEVITRIFEKDTDAEKTKMIQDAIKNYDNFLVYLGFFGLLTSIAALVSIDAGVASIASLRKKWNELRWSINFISTGHLPLITGGGNSRAHKYGKMVSYILPLFFMVFWLSIVFSLKNHFL
jgi:hypothetical protein